MTYSARISARKAGWALVDTCVALFVALPPEALDALIGDLHSAFPWSGRVPIAIALPVLRRAAMDWMKHRSAGGENMTNPNLAALAGLPLDQIKPFLPLLLASVPEHVEFDALGGRRQFPLRKFLAEAAEDGKFDNGDLLRAVTMLLTAPAKPRLAEAPVVVIPAPASQPPQPSVPVLPAFAAPQPQFGTPYAWIEELWHAWLADETGHEDGWAPDGSPTLRKFLDRQAPIPPGSVVRFKAEELPNGSRLHRYAIEHVLVIGGVEHVIPNTSGEEHQPLGDLGHVGRGPRWREANGWDMMVRFRTVKRGPLDLVYYVRTPGGAIESGKVEVILGTGK